jgi:hypothetical protein
MVIQGCGRQLVLASPRGGRHPALDMISIPSLLMIGAAHRNAGKTGFACAVIRRQAAAYPITAVKVTSVEAQQGLCPRGGDGCGTCASLDGAFCLSEEKQTDQPKDTSRLLQAGAVRVLWLRVRREHLADGAAALVEAIPAGTLVVCESNSLRQVIEPGVFLVTRRADDPSVKPSCAAVAHLADRVLVFHGDGWDLSPERVDVEAGRWVLRPVSGTP